MSDATNNVTLIGRLTRDPYVSYTSSSQMAVARMTLAIDRPARSDGERHTDFPQVKCFGRLAENCEKYLAKGRLVAINGSLQTGSYVDRNGATVYTTEVVATSVKFLESANSKSARTSGSDYHNDMPDSFEEVQEDVPF